MTWRILALALALLVLVGAAPLVYDINDISVVSIDTSSGPQSYTLPYAPGFKQAILVKDWNGHASSNNITVTAPNGLIDGAASFVINANYENVIFVNNGQDWNISGAAVGTAGGDLCSSFPNPIVCKINGNPLGPTTPTSANLLIANGTQWNSTAMSGDTTITSAGAVNVGKINGNPLGSTTPTSANLLIANGTLWQSLGMSGDTTITSAGAVTVVSTHLSAPLPIGQGGTGNTTGQPSGLALGDLSGNYPNPTVAKINTHTLGSTTPTSGNLLIADGSQWNTVTMSGGATINSSGVVTVAASGGTAGGDLSGTYPNPTVAKINGGALGTTTPTSANILVADGSAWQSVALSSGATISSSGVVTLHGSLPPNGSAGGDLSGSYPNPTVAKINGASLGTTTASSGNLLLGNGSSWNTAAMSGAATINSSGVVTLTAKANAEATATAAGSTSTTGTMLGLKGSITPATTGTVEFIIAGSAHHGNAGGTLNQQIRYGTGAAPNNGDPLTGTAVGLKLGMQSPNAGNKEQITNVARVTGLSVGTAYWYDISLDNGGSGTATVDLITGDAYEQ